MDIIRNNIRMSIDGMGLIICSAHTAKSISEGEDYLNNEYAAPEQVDKHIRQGDMVGFCTGSGGDYNCRFLSGYPTDDVCHNYPTMIRLAIRVKGGQIQIRDLFDLAEWSQVCPEEQTIDISDGIYHLTVCTARPKSGIIGDNQEILIYLNQLDDMPLIVHNGVPQLIP